MKTSWPRVYAQISRKFRAAHSLPSVGVAEVHEHDYEVTCGWHHEINPQRGVTKRLQDMERDVDPIIAALLSQPTLNEVLPVPPTAEMLACWILAQLPPYWGFVEVRAYNGFACRIERGDMTQSWFDMLRGQKAVA